MKYIERLKVEWKTKTSFTVTQFTPSTVLLILLLSFFSFVIYPSFLCAFIRTPNYVPFLPMYRLSDSFTGDPVYTYSVPALESRRPPPNTNVRPPVYRPRSTGVFPLVLSSPVMTNCPKWAWSRSRDVLIFWQISGNPFNASCSKLLLFEGFSAILA